MNTILSRILERYKGDKNAAMRYCIRVAIQFPQLKEEYDGYAKELAKLNNGRE